MLTVLSVGEDAGRAAQVLVLGFPSVLSRSLCRVFGGSGGFSLLQNPVTSQEGEGGSAVGVWCSGGSIPLGRGEVWSLAGKA